MKPPFEEYVEKVSNKFELYWIIIFSRGGETFPFFSTVLIDQLTSNIHEIYIFLLDIFFTFFLLEIYMSDAPFSTLDVEFLLLVLS